MSFHELQFINLLLTKKDPTLISKYGITENHFIAHRDVYEYIQQHREQFKDFPAIGTVSAKFESFELTDPESPDYVVGCLNKELALRKHHKLLLESAQHYNEKDVVAGLQTLEDGLKEIKLLTTPATQIHDWAANADERFEHFKTKAEAPESAKGIPTGFPGLDRVFNGGLQPGDVAVVFARMKNYKSWVGERIGLNAFIHGYDTVIWSLEMNEMQTGFRLDTMYRNFSNRGLAGGNLELVTMSLYEEYIHDLQGVQKHLWIATNEHNGGRQWTVPQIKAKAEELKAQLIMIDQLSLLGWDRKYPSKTVAYDTMAGQIKAMAMDLKVPVVLLAQAGRQFTAKVKENKNALPENDDIQWSDSLMQYADKGIALRKFEDHVALGVTANRGGEEGAEFAYSWNIDTGVLKNYDKDIANF